VIHELSGRYLPLGMNEVESEVSLVTSWFSSWDVAKKEHFLDRLVAKVTPDKLFALTQFVTLSESERVVSESCTTFKDQVEYFDRCFANWSTEQRNYFVNKLESIDYNVMCTFYDKVASTAGQI